MNSGFERGIEDIVGSVSSAAKKSIVDTVKMTGQQIVGNQSTASKPGSSEMSSFETNSTTSSQAQQQKNPSSLDPAQAQQQTIEEQQHLAKVRMELQNRHMTTYYNPTFNQKPKAIEQEREQKWQQSQAQEKQKKEQTEFIQEEKRKEYTPISRDLKAKGEIGKVGSG